MDHHYVTRFASKSSRNLHKTSEKSRIGKTERNVAKGAPAARVQRSKMLWEQKRAALLKEKRASSGSASPPRVIILFGLSADANLNSLAEDILSLLSPQGYEPAFPTATSPEYKLRTTHAYIGDHVGIFKEQVELDDENKAATLIGLEGEMFKYYKRFKAVYQFTQKDEGTGIANLWIDYEKLNEDIEAPDRYIGLMVNLVQDLDAHFLGA